MKPQKKRVYHLMKDSELKKVMKDAGLDIKGSRRELVARHQRFCVIWNDQCDQVRMKYRSHWLILFYRRSPCPKCKW